MFYFERLTTNRFRASEHVSGAWDIAEQHVAPALGLLAHAIEQDHVARHQKPLKISRISYDILGTFAIGEVEIEVAVTRPGRTIELVEARLSYGGRVAVAARAWLLQALDTSALAGSAMARIPPPDAMEDWQPQSYWPGNFVRSVEVRRSPLGQGRGFTWVRTKAALIAGESVSPTAAAFGIIDIANGLVPRVAAGEAAFPNVDLTVHIFDEPQGPWLGFDTAVSFGSHGIGLTHSVLHDERGPIGTISQSLTIRC